MQYIFNIYIYNSVQEYALCGNLEKVLHNCTTAQTRFLNNILLLKKFILYLQNITTKTQENEH